MAEPRIPANILNGLPLVTATTAADPGDIQIVGNTLTKQWSPSQLGISDTARTVDPDTGGGALLLSNYLDVRGCSAFVFLLAFNIKTAAGIEVGPQAYNLYMHYRTGPAGIAQRTGSYGTSWTPLCAQMTVSPNTDAVFPRTDLMALVWSNVSNAVGPGKGVGTDARVWIRLVGFGASNPVNLTFTAYMWGAQ